MQKLFLIGFQDSATPIMEGIVDFHNHIFFFIVLVLVFVFWIFSFIIIDFLFYNRHIENVAAIQARGIYFKTNDVTHGTVIEVIWTLIPCVILVLIAIPSFALLYSMDEIVSPSVTLKVIGHQWYWSYEYSDYVDVSDVSSTNLAFDSYMIPEADLKKGFLRLLEVDNEVVLPVKTHVRVVITADDVLHSWSVNSLGIKLDAVPGRLSQIGLYLKREGVFYGQCSEICGVNHGFMPIVVKGVSVDNYLNWVMNKLNS